VKFWRRQAADKSAIPNELFEGTAKDVAVLDALIWGISDNWRFDEWRPLIADSCGCIHECAGPDAARVVLNEAVDLPRNFRRKVRRVRQPHPRFIRKSDIK